MTSSSVPAEGSPRRRFCSQCGGSLPSIGSFCAACGMTIGAEAGALPVPSQAVASAHSAEGEQPAQPLDAPSAPATSSSAHSRKSGRPLVGVIVALVLLGGGIATALALHKSGGQDVPVSALTSVAPAATNTSATSVPPAAIPVTTTVTATAPVTANAQTFADLYRNVNGGVVRIERRHAPAEELGPASSSLRTW